MIPSCFECRVAAAQAVAGGMTRYQCPRHGLQDVGDDPGDSSARAVFVDDDTLELHGLHAYVEADSLAPGAACASCGVEIAYGQRCPECGRTVCPGEACL